MKRLFQTLLCTLFGIGCTDPQTAIRAQEAVEAGAALIDVRSQGEFAGGHIRGARNVPVGDLGSRIEDVTQDTVVVYCASGMRSANAARVLTAAGKEVVDLGGMGNWPDSADVVR